MQSNYNIMRYGWGGLGLLALAIVAYVLFQYPQPGVADQGDFDRVMNVSGLELSPAYANDPNLSRFLDYPVTDYKISDTSILGLLSRLGATSMAYVITFITLICKLLGQDTFKTGYLAIAYLIMYGFAMYVILKYLNIKNQLKLILFGLMALLVFWDGNYLVWFNSLYGEPMMIATLTLYIAAWIYYIYHRHILNSKDQVWIKIIFTFVTAFLFLGSKMQVISALPIILLLQVKLCWENRLLLKRHQRWLLYLFLGILIIYPLQLNFVNKGISKDTQYNSVFFGILKDADNPVQDLIDMGLNPDLAVDAGKHAFLAKGEYVKYVPHTQITQNEFYSKISNGKLLKFYITHPSRFMQGMKYTAEQVFITRSSWGKYPRQYSEIPINEFNRFTWWSSFREHYLPKSLAFLLMVYVGIFIISINIFINRPGLHAIRAKLTLLWAVIFIGLLQFPMPYLGNGQADTAKQLFLFNFVFDGILVVSLCWGFNILIDSCRNKGTVLPFPCSKLYEQ